MDDSIEDKDFQCTLCFDLFMYPVSLPCKHRFCKVCFDQHIECNGFHCPLCRARLSNWLRKIRLTNSNIVDTKFWGTIKKLFPKEIEKRRKNDDPLNSSLSTTCKGQILVYKISIQIIDNEKKNSMNCMHSEMDRNMALDWGVDWKGWPTPVWAVCRDVLDEIVHQTSSFYQNKQNVRKPRLSEPGELRKEFENFNRQLEEENRRRDETNFRLSEALIKMIEDDERKEIEERNKQIEGQLKSDEELARRLLEEESNNEVAVQETEPKTPRRRKFKKPKESDVSGYTDATNSSAYQNSEEFNRSFFGDSPVFMGPGQQTPERETVPVGSFTTTAIVHCSTPIPLDTPSTSKEDVFAKYFSAVSTSKKTQSPKRSPIEGSPKPKKPALVNCMAETSSTVTFSNKELSHFASVMPGPSKVPAESSAEKHGTMSRSSSGADSIGQELHHFKPIRSSPTTPPKYGSSSLLPHVVVAQRKEVGELSRTPNEEIQVLCSDSLTDLSTQDLEESLALERQLEEDRNLALKMQREWNAEVKKSRLPTSTRTDYNLRKRRKGTLRKKVLIDRAQATLDSMLIK